MANLTTALEVSLVGLAVVFGALVLIGLVISLLARLGDGEKHEDDQQAPAGIPPEIIAAISAAVTMALGPGVRIKRVRYGVSESETWSQQGRVIVMASHETRE